MKNQLTESEIKHLKLLGEIFPTINSTCTEIINLQAILRLPKGTEHFLSDIHGEYHAFNHVLKNCSGVIKEKIDMLFSNALSEREKNQLATVIYYPEEKIDTLTENFGDIDEWYRVTINRMLSVLKIVVSKYTSSKVRKALPKEFQYIIQEMLYEKDSDSKKTYVSNIINSIVEIGQGKQFIIAMAELIQRLTIDRLHIVGDIYDRGPAPHKIMDRLSQYHNVDIQWGNHDILWMGAAAGQLGAIANVVRICTRYGNNDILEDGYGINLLPLAAFAMEYYQKDPCARFVPKLQGNITEKNISLISKMHKAISIIQFKIEAEIIARNPLYDMDSRNLLHRIDYKNCTINIEGFDHKLEDCSFPTVDREDPYRLTEDEHEVLMQLKRSFLNSDKLQKHAQLLFSKGEFYKKYNGNLLYHGCIPLDSVGEFEEINITGDNLKGEKLLKTLDRMAREGYLNQKNIEANDMLWYLWCGPHSPLFGKNEMKTFERYFINDKETHTEKKNNYYNFCTQTAAAKKILTEFGLDSNRGYIINGHVPVKVRKGESPVKADGRLIIIDGGFSSAYQRETGIAGYTLIYNSQSLRIVTHEPFEGVEDAIINCQDIFSTTEIVEMKTRRITVNDTDIGKDIAEQISDLKKLLDCYRKGIIPEKPDKIR